MHSPVNVLSQHILSWHEPQWQQLWQAKQQNRFPHALLLGGIEGLGKKQFALALAKTLLCYHPSDKGIPCKSCHSCYLLKAKTHPDLHLVEPEQSGKSIGVDQIREVISKTQETTLKGGYRIIIIDPAVAMNHNASNALLKTLEEPATNTLFILVSNQSARLPATIISRCQKIQFSIPLHTEALAWLSSQINDRQIDLRLLLKLADGAPLKALAWLEKDLLSLRKELYEEFHMLSQGQADPLELAAKWQDENQLCVVDLLLSWLTDLLRFKLTHNQSTFTNEDYRTEITKIGITLLHANLLAYIEQLQQTRSHLLTSASLNKQLLLEELFIRWTAYVSR